jgi:hypothetical protein
MRTIGIDSPTGLGGVSETNASWQILLSSTDYSLVARIGERLIELGAYIGVNVGDGTGIELCLADITNGTAAAPIVATAVITTLVTASRNSVAIEPVALIPGHRYAVGVRVRSATSVSLLRVFTTNAGREGALTGADLFGSAWSDKIAINQRYGIFGITEDETIFEDDFDRADADTLGDDYTVATLDSGEPVFSIVDNKARLTFTPEASLHYAYINPALFTSANYRVETPISFVGGVPLGALLRLSSPGASMNGYFVYVYGAGTQVDRYNDGVETVVGTYQYYGPFESEPMPLTVAFETETVDDTVEIRIYYAVDGVNFVLVRTVVDSDPERITATGTAALARFGNYTVENITEWYSFKVVGPSVVPDRWGFLLEDLREPNSPDTVSASGVRVIIRSAIGGTELSDASDGEIVDGNMEYEYGTDDSTVDVELRWTEGSDPRFYAETLTLVNLDS